jgi:hypothetical protein
MEDIALVNLSNELRYAVYRVPRLEPHGYLARVYNVLLGAELQVELEVR